MKTILSSKHSFNIKTFPKEIAFSLCNQEAQACSYIVFLPIIDALGVAHGRMKGNESLQKQLLIDHICHYTLLWVKEHCQNHDWST